MQKAKIMISQLHPRLLIVFLKSVRKDKTYTKEEVVERIKKLGENQTTMPKLISELIGILDDFGIIKYHSKEDLFDVTEFGLFLKSILLKNEQLFFEIYHLISYYSFDINKGNLKYLPFRSYQLLCDNIYNNKNMPDRIKLADEIETTITRTYNVQGAFDETCVTRGLAWLKQLSPPIFDDKFNYNKRVPDNIESILWNINLLYKVKGLRYGDPLFLDSKIIETIACASIMDSASLEKQLKRLNELFPSILNYRTSVSGTFLILTKEVNLNEIF